MKTLGNIAHWSARHRISVLALSAISLLLLGAGASLLTFSDNPVDAMPRGNPHTDAAEELVDRFPGSAFTGALYVQVAPEKWEAANDKLPNRLPFGSDEAQEGQGEIYDLINTALPQLTDGNVQGLAKGFPGPNNITDEVYMRGQEELFLFLMDEVEEMAWGITLPSQVKLINYTNTGIPNVQPPDAAAFRLPDTSPEGAALFNNNWQTYFIASPDSTKSIVSKDWSSARMGLIFQPGDARLDEIGNKLYDGVDAYRDEVRACDAGLECSLEWNVFNPDEVIVDPRAPSAAAGYLTSTTLEDLVLLAPFAAVFILGAMLLAFRRPGTVAALMIPMGLAGIGVLGIFGLIGLPIHSTSLLVFPVLMGNGIDFAIHMTSAYHNARAQGADPYVAAREAGEHAGTPLVIATLTTIIGMLLLVMAPNRLLSQLGMAILIGMALLLIVSLTALPAALSYVRPVKTKRDLMGAAMATNARFWNRAKPFGAILVVGTVAAAGWAGVGQDVLIIGTPASFFPEGDEQRREFDHTNDVFFKGNEDLVTNALVMQGDIATPEAMDFMHRLEGALKDIDFVRNETAVTLHFAVNAWIQVREGTAGTAPVILQESVEPGSTFPDDKEGIKFLIDEMFETPLATYASFFVNHPDDNDGNYDISVALVEIYQAEEFEDLEAQWDHLMRVVKEVEADGPPSGLSIHFSGQTAVAYLFTKEEMPYLKVAGIVGIAITGLLVLAIRRNARDALTVTAVVGTAGVWWLGTLALFNIPLSVALVVPIVIIAAIGSDYALHLRYGLARDGPVAWRRIGRAVLFSALTDLGAFMVFTQMRYGLLADATLATATALTCSLLATMIIVPLFAKPSEMEATA